ncbi:hypothetical protein DBV39_04845 [Orrella marina]|uniref:Uncharacterized protein n=1 Tax=Orrella marina TaxID=2163011 RepID=A0A2R4XH42_9BURK|nr:hypothetical protein DBV39_04845 [Orrella marina]
MTVDPDNESGWSGILARPAGRSAVRQTPVGTSGSTYAASRNATQELPGTTPIVKHLVVTREFPSVIPGRGSGSQRMVIPAAGHTLA